MSSNIPFPEALAKKTQQEVRKQMDKYAKRAVRALVPEEKQARAAWGNFALRTNTKLARPIGNRGVHVLLLGVVFILQPTMCILWPFSGFFHTFSIGNPRWGRALGASSYLLWMY